MFGGTGEKDFKVLVNTASNTEAINLILLLRLTNKTNQDANICEQWANTKIQHPIHPGYSLPNNDKLQPCKFEYIPRKLGRTYLDPQLLLNFYILMQLIFLYTHVSLEIICNIDNWFF